MPNYLHRTNDIYLTSFPEIDLPEPLANYIQDPDLSLVAGFPIKYWTITGDSVTLMSQAERDAVDAAIQLAAEDASRTASINALTEPLTGDALGGHQIRALIELFNKRDNFNTTRIIELQNRVQAMLDSTGAVANMRTDGLAVSISGTNTRARPAAISDYNDIITSGSADT